MIKDIWTASGREYKVGKLSSGHYQYMDRLYQFNYIPQELSGCDHIMTCGKDKMIPETSTCFSFRTDVPVEVYVLYPDKQPVIPKWLDLFERTRLNVTRMDSESSNLKGYFSLYKRYYPAGEIVLGGNSPMNMLEEDWYIDTRGSNYCMYTVAVCPVEELI